MTCFTVNDRNGITLTIFLGGMEIQRHFVKRDMANNTPQGQTDRRSTNMFSYCTYVLSVLKNTIMQGYQMSLRNLSVRQLLDRRESILYPHRRRNVIWTGKRNFVSINGIDLWGMKRSKEKEWHFPWLEELLYTSCKWLLPRCTRTEIGKSSPKSLVNEINCEDRKARLCRVN